MTTPDARPAADLVIWARPEGGGRGPRPAHSRQDIAAAGITIADAEGIDAVSMRRVAAEIGAGTTSLYRYVRNKDELLDLMADAAFGQEELPAAGADWQAGLREIARRNRAVLLRHPWLAALSPGRPALGPNGLRWLEAMFQIAARPGLTADDTLAVVGTLLTFVRGHVSTELAERQAGERSGVSPAQWMAAQGRYGEEIIGGGRYPALSKIMVEATSPHDPDRFATSFTAGLGYVLAGLAAAFGTG
ncbi:MAG TPA: TetR/AcrR family transcriptional regulator [Streptosporangiaceae bacterium]|nr:TetR/AcrR family transcriptional regulator [Streptosporangiaceae bacterium]